MSDPTKDKEPEQTQMQAPQAKNVKMVRVKAIRGFHLKGHGVVQPGSIIEVPETTAKDLCRTVEGSCDFYGERYEESVVKAKIQNAQRVA